MHRSSLGPRLRYGILPAGLRWVSGAASLCAFGALLASLVGSLLPRCARSCRCSRRCRSSAPSWGPIFGRALRPCVSWAHRASPLRVKSLPLGPQVFGSSRIGPALQFGGFVFGSSSGHSAPCIRRSSAGCDSRCFGSDARRALRGVRLRVDGPKPHASHRVCSCRSRTFGLRVVSFCRHARIDPRKPRPEDRLGLGLFVP